MSTTLIAWQVINACLLTSAWSAASSDLYTSSRALCKFIPDQDRSLDAVEAAEALLTSFLLSRWSCYGRKRPKDFQEDISPWPAIHGHWHVLYVWFAVLHGSQRRLGASLRLVCEYDIYSRYFDDSCFASFCISLLNQQHRTPYVVWYLSHLHSLSRWI
jgi:hypothetical protein